MAEEIPFLDLAAANEELGPELRAAMTGIVDAGQYIGGPALTEFEAAWAGYCGTASCVGASNGLDALSLIFRAAGIGRGDEVIVPSWTFIATWLAVTEAGATPVPAEVDPVTGTLDPASVAAARGPRTRAVVPVHLYGRLASMDALQEAAGPDTLLIEDAAQAHGATDARGRRAGSLGDAAAFSFYPAKNLGALGDAGAITSDDDELAATARQLGNYGAREKYHHELAGRNARLDPLQAAVLTVKLARLDAWNERRRRIAARYEEALGDLEWLHLPPGDDPGCVWHLYVVRTSARDALAEHLRRAGVASGLHYPVAPHRSGAFAGRGYEFPIADKLAATVLSLPIGPHLTTADADRIVAAVTAFQPSM